VDLRSAQLLVIGALNWTPEWWTGTSVPLDTLIYTARALTRQGLAAAPPPWPRTVGQPFRHDDRHAFVPVPATAGARRRSCQPHPTPARC